VEAYIGAGTVGEVAVGGRSEILRVSMIYI